MKLCINCKHNEREQWCVAPVNGVSPVDGRPNPSFASVARGNSVLSNGCGIDAVHFEQKPPPPVYFFDGNPRPSVTVTGSSTGFLHMVFQLFGKRK